MRTTITRRQAGKPETECIEADAGALASELRSRIRGEVRFDPGSRALYATDGYSCREQIVQLVGKRALHLAEVIWMAIQEGRQQQASRPQR